MSSEDSDNDSGEDRKNKKKAININGLLGIMKIPGMTENHLSECKRTPFYRLLKGLYDRKDKYTSLRKSDVLIKQVIDSYSTVSSSFIIGGREIQITEREIKILLGIECGFDHLPKQLTVEANYRSSWYRRIFGSAGKVNLKDLSGKIAGVIKNFEVKELTLEAKEDIAKLLTIYTLTSLCLSKRHYQAKQIHISICEDLDRVKDYNWAGEMRSYIFRSIRKCSDTSRVKGGLFVLLPWLFERVKDIGRLKEGEEDVVPRCLKWECMLGASKIKLESVKKNKVRRKEIQASAEEEGWLVYERDNNNGETDKNEGECSGTVVKDGGEKLVGEKNVEKAGDLNEHDKENDGKRVSDDEDINVDGWMNDKGDGLMDDVNREDEKTESVDKINEKVGVMEPAEKEQVEEGSKDDGVVGEELLIKKDTPIDTNIDDKSCGSEEEEMEIEDYIDYGPPRGGEEVDKNEMNVDKDESLSKEEETDLNKTVGMVIHKAGTIRMRFNGEIEEGKDSTDPVVNSLREKLVESGNDRNRLIDELESLTKERDEYKDKASKCEEMKANIETLKKEKAVVVQIVETLSNQVHKEEVRGKELEDAIVKQEAKINRLRVQIEKLKEDNKKLENESIKKDKEHKDISEWYNESLEELEKYKSECENLRAAAKLLELSSEKAGEEETKEKGVKKRVSSNKDGDTPDLELVGELKTYTKRRRSYRLNTPGSIERNVKTNNHAAAAAKNVDSDFVEEPRTKRVKVTMKQKGEVEKTGKKKVTGKQMKANVEEADKKKDAELSKKNTNEGDQGKKKEKWNGEDTVDEKDYNFLLQIKDENLGDAIWWDEENSLLVSGNDAFAVAHKRMIEVQVIDAMLKMIQEDYGVKGGKYSVTHQSAMSMSLVEQDHAEACAMYVAEPFYKNSQEYAFTLLPVFVKDGTSGHWSLLIYSRDNKEFYHYNSIKPKNAESIGSKTEQTAAKYRKYLVEKVLRKIKPGVEDKYILTNVDCVEQEPGSVDCGVFVILWCYAFYRNGVIRQKTHNQKYINEGRAMIVRRLLRSDKYSQHINKGKKA